MVYPGLFSFISIGVLLGRFVTKIKYLVVFLVHALEGLVVQCAYRLTLCDILSDRQVCL